MFVPVSCLTRPLGLYVSVYYEHSRIGSLLRSCSLNLIQQFSLLQPAKLVFVRKQHDQLPYFFSVSISQSGSKFSFLDAPARVVENLSDAVRGMWPHRISADRRTEDGLFVFELRKNTSGQPKVTHSLKPCDADIPIFGQARSIKTSWPPTSLGISTLSASSWMGAFRWGKRALWVSVLERSSGYYDLHSSSPAVRTDTIAFMHLTALMDTGSTNLPVNVVFAASSVCLSAYCVFCISILTRCQSLLLQLYVMYFHPGNITYSTR